ncbi:DNA-directed RNA polymerase subunit omega [Clostridium botulinum]|uniref:DNA-directed RNA polymerase subunit omega n=1 Tax=Clostridium botulinum C/D str. DC5 TaxID=1443128 RepID=A0A0A0IIN7_CLOBO|nr:DNA-directed RNA polymerase subunit omega [Clostridium botulinum]KEI01471.1 DNA-directed RNA polymerase subunit omega [Clostridium botulinum C/D str. BKT75002]KEI07805.1 DNA-directed RNA polymerase subunit omega [Clostridium botulinum C/D str. BKT2873]KGM94137.1 DNA-directed RNA polymerase subunit omega [Clostridium botulinum D str. CCUG 7971]KGN01295.1 DNA-directed RNA polymerase subunit omega [Clostridium botulinum C/D str. DC5]KOC49590.1 DNA-directed RNA polymerase subunit omega [Clostri
MNNYMINPSIVELLTKVDNRYSLVTVTSKRARQIIDGDEMLVNVEDAYKPLTTAIHEVNSGEVTYESLMKGIK